MECCHLGKILLLTLLIITFGYFRSILVNILIVFVLCMRVVFDSPPRPGVIQSSRNKTTCTVSDSPEEYYD